MLKRLELTCFRKHESLVVNFSEGLHVVRGSNEAGKSTMIEGILYAFYGARVLADTMDETVTWGHAPSELKSVVQFGDYTFSRSPKGAEVTQDGKVFVTGQNEVSAFSASLLGADAQAAAKLMLANQGNLRGALEAGPRAVTEQIESLADFDLFDRLIEAMQTKLMLGNPSVLEETLRQKEGQLAAFVMPPEPSKEESDRRIADLQNQVDLAQHTLDDLRQTEKTSQQTLDDLKTTQAQINGLKSTQSRLTGEIAQATADRAAALALASAMPADSVVADLRKRVGDLESEGKRMEAWKAFGAWKHPDTVWEGDRDGFDREVADNLRQTERCRDDIRSAESRLTLARGSIIDGDTCKSCGQRLSNADDIHRQNAECQGVIVEAQSDLATYRERLATLQKDLDLLNQVARADRACSDLLQRISPYVTVGAGTLPPVLTWVGEPPVAGESTQDVKTRLATVEAQIKDCQRAEARAEALEGQIAGAQKGLDLANAELAALAPVTQADITEALDKVTLVRGQVAAAALSLSTLESMVRLERLAFEEALRIREEGLKTLEGLEGQVTKARGDLSTLHFNNGLLKKVRAARPIIGDRLWATVLASVSQMFSLMRGEKSVVIKSKDGFSVNGHSAASLSGSAKDLLGLSIRIALVRTFLPTCPFLVLDEPAAAMDESRTSQMLGFIASCGFNQVILVTHEDTSETFSDHIIQL